MTQRLTAGEITVACVHDALGGERVALDRIVAAATPIVHARVARLLLRRSSSVGRDLRQEVEDLSQDVFVALFVDDAKVLRTWEPSLGLSFANFVGLVAQRRAASLMRHKHYHASLDDSTEASHEEDASAGTRPDTQAISRETLLRLFEELQTSLSPRGLDLFHRLYVDEQSIADICEATGLGTDAVYQWKSRLGRAAREALQSLLRDTPVSERPRPAPVSLRARPANASQTEAAAVEEDPDERS